MPVSEKGNGAPESRARTRPGTTVEASFRRRAHGVRLVKCQSARKSVLLVPLHRGPMADEDSVAGGRVDATVSSRDQGVLKVEGAGK